MLAVLVALDFVLAADFVELVFAPPPPQAVSADTNPNLFAPFNI